MLRGLAILAALSAAAPGAEEDRPFVEILQDLGAIDGPADAAVGVPQWERVRLELQLANRLPYPVRALEVEVKLVHATRDEADIPGWTFRETIEDVVLDPTEKGYVRLTRALPPRRSSPRAEEIAYRVRLLTYRVASPDLETSLRLLRSSAAWDQRAALDSYGSAEGAVASAEGARELALTLAALPPTPAAPDALRMLFAVQALGSLGAVEHLPRLLELVDRVDRARWGRAVLELATRMVAASTPGEPRLDVLPSWARTKSALLEVRAEDALEESVRDALLRMGDGAVPGLLLAAHDHPSPPVRTRARRLLHALGRSTVRSQLGLRDRAHRLGVVHALGRIGAPEPVPALAELLEDRDGPVRLATRAALLQIGAPAIRALVDGLGAPRDKARFETLVALGERHPAEVFAAAAAYGLPRAPRESATAILGRLRARLTADRRANLVSELEQALALGEKGDYVGALRRLDFVFEQDRKVYMARAPAIATLYTARARAMMRRGDFDAAVETARTGLSIATTPDGQSVLQEARLSLVRGFTELGQLDRAQRILSEVENPDDPAVRRTKGRLLVQRAIAAAARGDGGLARALVDKARSLGIDTPELDRADRELLLKENLAVVITLSLLVPAALLALVLTVRYRLQRARMHRLAQAIDEDPGHAPAPSEGRL